MYPIIFATYNNSLIWNVGSVFGRSALRVRGRPADGERGLAGVLPVWGLFGADLDRMDFLEAATGLLALVLGGL